MKQTGMVGPIAQRTLQDHSREELDEPWNVGIAWERFVVGAQKKEKGIIGYPTHPPLGDYFVSDFSTALSGFAALLLDSALTDLAIIFPSFSV
jgi:hypothetical protein